MPKQLTPLDYALRYLQRQPKTSQEVRLKLFEKGVDEEKIDATIVTLGEMWLVDDRVFTEMYLSSEVMRKGKAVYLIRQKLMQRGIAKDIIDELIQQYEKDITKGMQDAIIAFVQKNKEKWDVLDMMQKLQRKGYSYDTIKQALEHIAEQ